MTLSTNPPHGGVRPKDARRAPLLARPVPAFFFASPTRTVLADEESGSAIEGTLRHSDRWLADVERRLAEGGAEGARGGLVVGALPFGEDTPVRLFHAARPSVLGTWQPEGAPSTSSRAPLPRAVDAGFMTAVDEATRAIASGRLAKVVLARSQELTLDGRVRLEALLGRLRARNPHGFTYALRLNGAASSQEEATCLVGASPELLLSRRGRRVLSVPLAGSIPRAADPTEDRERAVRLLVSRKDRHEHALVVDHVVERLRSLTSALRFEREPVVTATPTMWHLSTRIEGDLADPSISALRLAAALHPTPAVCGLPTAEARQWIERVEPFDRGYFTGSLGYVAANGDGDWIVTIRCAEITGSRVRVFAGAGIVATSEPASELAETDAKMSTVLGAILEKE